MTLTPSDYMTRALFHAARGRGRTSPNPLVGAVVVSADGVVVGQGFHERAGGPHAEVHALGAAGPGARGGTLYCTLEPCSHVGRTGPCAVRIVEAGISRVVAAVEDPNPLVSGKGFEFLRGHGVKVEVGLGETTARTLNQPFFTLMREGRPFVVIKAATSSDACIAEAPGRRTVLTSTLANRHAHRVRAEVDAIGVGVGTILVDDPLLTARGAYARPPSGAGDLRPVAPDPSRSPRALDTGRRPCHHRDHGVRSGARAEVRESGLEARGAEILVAPDTTRLSSALGCLGARDISYLLLEGGAAIHRAAWDEGVADFIRHYVTPHVLGAGGLRFLDGRQFSATGLFETHIETLGPDVLIEGYVHRPR